ncbi:MAG: 3D domain-containing protein [Sporomusaceae bacterium]|nr:3D domain-containing protein [Sporomusaceae bacterium]
MRRFLLVALIVANCLLLAGAVYIFPIIMHTAAVVLEQAALAQQAHERIDVLERALRVNTTPGPSRGGARVMKVTAYTAGPESTGKAPGHPAYGITSAGYRLTDADAWRVAAADPEHYPAGTKIFGAGVGLVTILDTGAAVRGPDHIDIFVGMSAVHEAQEWGVRRVPTRIIGRVN